MSIIIIAFPGAPKPSKDAIKAEQELESSLRKTIKGYYKKYFCRKIRTNIWSLTFISVSSLFLSSDQCNFIFWFWFVCVTLLPQNCVSYKAQYVKLLWIKAWGKFSVYLYMIIGKLLHLMVSIEYLDIFF